MHLTKVFDRLGLANDIKAKTVFHRNAAEAGAFIIDGKAEVGMNLIPELLPIAGIDVVGPLPADLQLTNIYAAALTSNAKDPTAGKALADFLRSPEAVSLIKATAMIHDPVQELVQEAVRQVLAAEPTSRRARPVVKAG